MVVAQAIGRWGNWFNQELFGRPSELPWALEIDLAHRPVGYELTTTFQPTFLYESIWCLLVFATIVWLERNRGLVKGQTFALYVAMYTFGRIFFEWMRVDPASKIFGVRFNLLLSVVLCVGATCRGSCGSGGHRRRSARGATRRGSGFFRIATRALLP